MTSILKADTIQDTDGNNIINENSNTITIGASGDTTNIIGTLQNNGAAVGGANTPIFFLNKTDSQSISNNTTTKVTFNSELIDTDSAVSSSTFTVPSGKAGKYFFVFTVTSEQGNDGDYLSAYIYHQGGIYARTLNRYPANVSLTSIVTATIDLSVGETVEAYVRQNTGSSQTVTGETAEKRTTFTGYKLIT